MRSGIINKIGMGCLLAAGLANAHLSRNHIAPEGADTLKIGDSFTIQWNVVAAHGKGTALAVSRDNGTTFTDIKAGITEQADLNTFKWTVTGPVANQARIRVCEGSDNPPPQPCTDADKSNSLSDAPNGHYVMITDAFHIKEGGTAVFAGSAASEPISIDYNSTSRNVDVTFGLETGKHVTLQAIDMQGRLVATLVDGRFEAGSHKLSVFSNRIEASAKSLVFKLKLGDQVHSHVWMSL